MAKKDTGPAFSFKYFSRLQLLRFIVPLICFQFITIQQLVASHQFGANITFNCVGQDSFLVKLTFYNECAGYVQGNTLIVFVYSPTCGNLPYLTVIRQPGAIRDITPLCPGWPSPCAGSGIILPLGLEEHVFTGLLVLPNSPSPPFPCDDWILSFSLCCRNTTVTTGSQSQNLFVSTLLNQGASPCNNSPQFGNDPVPFYCTGKRYHLNPGVFDPDGDSLSFSLVPCKTQYSSNVSYFSGLSYTQPIHTTGPITIDPFTGTITFMPSQVEVGVICIKVNEFRNGVKIGEVTRDVQIHVIACNNPPPQASGMNCTNNYDTTICPGQTISFNICSSDSNTADTVKMSWNGGIPAGAFITSAAQFPVGTFSWTPTLDDLGTHFFTVTVRDNACPFVGTNSLAYVIHVKSVDINLGSSRRICEGDTVSFKQLRPYYYTSYQWMPSAGVSDPSALNVILTPLVTTTYTLTATRGPCVYQTELTIYVKKKTKLFKPPVVELCRENPLDLASHPTILLWLPDGSEMRELPEIPVLLDEGPGKIIPVVIKDDYGCEYLDSILVRFRDKPIGGIMVLHSEDNDIKLMSANTHSRYLWSNKKGDVLSTNNALSVHDEPAGSIIYLTYWDEFGCQAIDSFYTQTEGFRVVLPNVFKPGSSIAANRTFGILDAELFELHYFRIYDHEAKLVFETDQVNVSWDGTIGGKLAQAGIYAYELKGRNIADNSNYRKNGSITLLH